MGKTLIIAEKPSVAADIAKALPGKFTKAKTHFESDDHIVSFAIGHLVGIAYPEEIDPALQKWSLDNLPILPEEFPLAVLPDTKAQFNALNKLIRRKDVEVIVNGCDAGREGELIFKYILRQAANRTLAGKQVKRLWLQSMTLDAIRDGLGKLRDDTEMRPLEDTALCRGGLADRHQRHPGAHLLQFPLRRVPQDPLRSGADPDPVAPSQAGGRAARVRARHLLGTARDLRLRPGGLRGRVDRPGICPRRRAGPRPPQPHLGGGPRRGHRRPLPGAAGHGGGDEQEVHQGRSAPL
jgi:hypothetical protein